MFCPKCRAEYVEGVTACDDCHVPLVLVLLPRPVDEAPAYHEFKALLATFNAGDIALIRSIFDGEDIDYYIQGEQFNNLDPLIQPAKLMVAKEQIAQARDLIKDLKLGWSVNKEIKEGPADEST